MQDPHPELLAGPVVHLILSIVHNLHGQRAVQRVSKHLYSKELLISIIWIIELSLRGHYLSRAMAPLYAESICIDFSWMMPAPAQPQLLVIGAGFTFAAWASHACAPACLHGQRSHAIGYRTAWVDHRRACWAHREGGIGMVEEGGPPGRDENPPRELLVLSPPANQPLNLSLSAVAAQILLYSTYQCNQVCCLLYGGPMMQEMSAKTDRLPLGMRSADGSSLSVRP